MLIAFADVIADMKANKKIKTNNCCIVNERKKLNISVGFLSKSYFAVPKTIRSSATHHFIMKIPN